MKKDVKRFLLTVALVLAALLALAACAPAPIAEQEPPVVPAPSVGQVTSEEGFAAVMTEEGARELEAVASSGRALCLTPEGGVLIAVVRDGDTAGGSGQETVLASAKDGIVRELSLPAFSDVASAAYSPTGRFLAILDIGDTATLYVYDGSTDTLYNMGEEGLGAQTEDYCWDAYADALYSLSGDGGLMLKKTDLREEAMETVEFLEERTVAGGNVAVAGEELYFSDAAEDMIYRYNFHTGEREEICPGTQFRLSPDALTLAIARHTGAGDSTDILLFDCATGESVSVIEGSSMVDMDFSEDGTLYIAQGGGTEGFPLEISAYAGGGLSQVCASRSQTVIVEGDALYLPVYFEDAGYVTYVCPLP